MTSIARYSISLTINVNYTLVLSKQFVQSSLAHPLIRKSGGIYFEEFDGAFADADGVFNEEVDEFVAVDEGDGGGAGGECGFDGAAGEIGGGDDGAAQGVEAVEGAAEGVEVFALDGAAVSFGLDDFADGGDAEFDFGDDVDAAVVGACGHFDVLVIHGDEQAFDEVFESDGVHFEEEFVQAFADGVLLVADEGPELGVVVVTDGVFVAGVVEVVQAGFGDGVEVAAAFDELTIE